MLENGGKTKRLKKKEKHLNQCVVSRVQVLELPQNENKITKIYIYIYIEKKSSTSPWNGISCLYQKAI